MKRPEVLIVWRKRLMERKEVLGSCEGYLKKTCKSELSSRWKKIML